MYEVTYLNISLSDRNLPVKNVEIFINGENFGKSNQAGELSKLFVYTQPKISLKLKADYYSIIDTTLNIVPGNNNF